MTQKIEIQDGLRVIPVLFGPQDTHRKLLERSLGVQIGWRDPCLTIEGAERDELATQNIIRDALAKISTGSVFFLSDIQRMIDVERAGSQNHEGFLKPTERTRTSFAFAGGNIRPKSDNQGHFIEMMKQKDLVFCSGRVRVRPFWRWRRR